MALSYINKGKSNVNQNIHENYKKSIFEFQERVKNMRLGYIPGVIRHYFHGIKKNRKYTERWEILVEHKYDPYLHITYDSNGLIIPTKDFPEKLKNDIFNYFLERNEDE